MKLDRPLIVVDTETTGLHPARNQVLSLGMVFVNRELAKVGRMEWFIKHRPDLCGNLASLSREGVESRRLLSVLARSRLVRVLDRLLDEAEFLSPHGIRSVSKFHEAHPFRLAVDGHEYGVDYEPAESRTGIFGGNSNWRGPVWFPGNYLLIESLQRFNHYFGEDLQTHIRALS